MEPADQPAPHHCRAYPLDDEGKVVGRKEFSAGDDDEAMRIARQLFPLDPVEVWCGTRVIGRLAKAAADSRGQQ
jgi:hypothetical protein